MCKPTSKNPCNCLVKIWVNRLGEDRRERLRREENPESQRRRGSPELAQTKSVGRTSCYRFRGLER